LISDVPPKYFPFVIRHSSGCLDPLHLFGELGA
jgi:hypothetical protein